MIPDGPTVYVVDDDASYLKGVVRFLRAAGLSAQAFSSAAEFLRHRAADAPGCVVADLQMPGMSGLELQEVLARSENPLPVVFLSGRGDIPTTVTAMRHGAEDFLTKSAPGGELLDAIRRALARDVQERQERGRRRELLARLAQLTPRDKEVLAHVLRGRLNKQIAADLGIDERSVKRHRTSIMAKLGVRSVAQLAHLASQVGLMT